MFIWGQNTAQSSILETHCSFGPKFVEKDKKEIKLNDKLIVLTIGQLVAGLILSGLWTVCNLSLVWLLYCDNITCFYFTFPNLKSLGMLAGLIKCAFFTAMLYVCLC